MRGLLDTSVFIAGERERPLARDRLPDEAAISVVTLAELELGVHMAASETARGSGCAPSRRHDPRTSPSPIDESIASLFAELVAIARRDGRRPKIQDAWIAATAHALGVAVYTQDSDFDELAVEVVRV